MELDEFDRRLLEALQRDSRRTGEELAAVVGLSAAACLRRAQRLREAGIIEREVAILAPDAVGRNLTMVVLVTLEREELNLLDEFKRRMQRAPEVMQCYKVTGDVDFVLIVAMGDMEEYNAFAERLVTVEHVRRYETLVVMDRVKFLTAMPIRQGD